MKRAAGGGELPGSSPSAKKQYPPPDTTDQAQTRSACRSLLTKAFVSPDAGSEAPMGDAVPLVNTIEQALYEKHAYRTTKEYKAAARGLGQNLKRNPELRGRLLAGELEAGHLVRMHWQELSTEQQREQDSKVQERLMRRVTLHDASGSAVQQQEGYKCPQCQSAACEVLDAGRRDIGKCETWGSKLSCDRDRLLTCLTCGHKWEVSGLV